MEVHFSDPYVGRRLAFRDNADPRRELCFIGNGEAGTCPNHFVGIVATVRFKVRRFGGKVGRTISLREYVTVTAQSPELPSRPPFERTQAVINGEVNDLQAFGYDENDIPESERAAERQKARQRLWRLCRQELYLNDEAEPFAIIARRYVLDAIEILRVQGK